MLNFFKSKTNTSNDDKKDKSKTQTNNISLIQVTKSDSNRSNLQSTNNSIKKSPNSISSNKSNDVQPSTSTKQSIFTISKSPKKQSNKQENKKPNEDKKKNVSSVFSMIIDSDINTEESNAEVVNTDVQMFDPEPATEEADTFDQITFIENKSFIEDDEVNEINSRKLNGLAKENNCYTVNEVPEGRLSKISSSRASSRSSVASDSTRGSSNIFGEQIINSDKKVEKKYESSVENSDSSFGNTSSQNGSKNILLDALLRKFNVSMDLDTNSDNLSSSKTVPLQKQLTRYLGDDKKKKQSDLQRKINRSNFEKQTLATHLKEISMETEDKVEASSSFDDDPKQIKVIKNTSTQISLGLNKRSSNSQLICVTKLPQHFECKYIGKTKCQGLWGLKHIREPVDRLIQKARRLRSLEDLVDVEALVNEKGIYVVQKSKPITSKAADEAINTQKYYKSGILPISNISYAVQDNVYGKVFSCIVVKESNGKTISECYSFLCKQNEISRKMALSITLAFKEYGKLLQLKETRISRTIKMNDSPSEINGDSFA